MDYEQDYYICKSCGAALDPDEKCDKCDSKYNEED